VAGGVIEVLFWLCLLVPLYAYGLFPLFLWLCAGFLRRPVRKSPIEPSVSLLIPAYAEGEQVRRKIENSLAIEYPAAKLEIVITCDGDKNDTPRHAREAAAGTRVRVLVQPVNRGKIANLNAAVPTLQNEIIVFSDTSALLEPDCLRKILPNFADPQVGAISGRYTVIEAGAVNIGHSEDLYWRYETFLKDRESAIHSMLGGHGQLHAIRRELYPFPVSGTINDDYVIPYSVLGKGFRAVYEPTARVFEEAREMTGFQRRVRIMAGNIQQLNLLGTLLWPLRFWPLFFTLSHKASRLLVPFALLLALALNVSLAQQPVYAWVLAGQLSFYVLAIAGALVRLRPRLLMLPYYFSMINAAVFLGVYHALTNRRSMAWK